MRDRAIDASLAKSAPPIDNSIARRHAVMTFDLILRIKGQPTKRRNQGDAGQQADRAVTLVLDFGRRVAAWKASQIEHLKEGIAHLFQLAVYGKLYLKEATKVQDLKEGIRAAEAVRRKSEESVAKLGRLRQLLTYDRAKLADLLQMQPPAGGYSAIAMIMDSEGFSQFEALAYVAQRAGVETAVAVAFEQFRHLLPKLEDAEPILTREEREGRAGLEAQLDKIGGDDFELHIIARAPSNEVPFVDDHQPLVDFLRARVLFESVARKGSTIHASRTQILAWTPLIVRARKSGYRFDVYANVLNRKIRPGST